MAEEQTGAKLEPGGDVELTFERAVEEGEHRLTRSWPALLATGIVGGLDVGIGVFALLVVREETGSALLGALAFTLGFIALALAGSELFTENFFVPIAAVIAKRDLGPVSLLRLWGGTFAMNLVGGFVAMGLVVISFPHLEATAVEVGRHYPDMGIGPEAMASGLLGGLVITLMTWMERGVTTLMPKLVANVAAAFLLAAGPLNHAVIAALEMSAGLIAGAPYGYLDVGGAIGLATVANMVGGIAFVTVVRLIQVGSKKVEEERQK